MTDKKIVSAVIMDEQSTISVIEICQTCNISQETLLEMMEYGLFNHLGVELHQAEFDLGMLKRIQTARRLQEDLGVNLPGVVLIMELLDDINALQDELDILKRHLTD